MKHWKFQQIWFFLLITGLLSSCVNLQHVSDFSQTAALGIGQYETLPHSFTQNCLDDCRLNNLKKLDIHHTDCDCSTDQKADSITKVIYTALNEYFHSLSNIANNKLTRYHTEGLSNTLSSNNIGPIILNPEDVDAYSKLSTIILRAFSDGYRRKEIKKYVVQADESIQILLKYLDLNISGNLKGKLEVQKAMVKNYYFDLVNSKKLSVYERTKFAEDYFKTIKNIENKQAALDDYSNILKGIILSHASLKENIDKLSNAEIKNLLSNYDSQIQKTILYFNRDTK